MTTSQPAVTLKPARSSHAGLPGRKQRLTASLVFHIANSAPCRFIRQEPKVFGLRVRPNAS